VVVAPISVIPFVIVKVDVQSAVPAGTTTVSPSTAEAMAVATSTKEGLAALMIVACATPDAAKNIAARTEVSFLPGRPYSPEGTA
jgi:hypothetical protein